MSLRRWWNNENYDLAVMDRFLIQYPEWSDLPRGVVAKTVSFQAYELREASWELKDALRAEWTRLKDRLGDGYRMSRLVVVDLSQFSKWQRWRLRRRVRKMGGDLRHSRYVESGTAVIMADPDDMLAPIHWNPLGVDTE